MMIMNLFDNVLNFDVQQNTGSSVGDKIQSSKVESLIFAFQKMDLET